MPKNDWQLQFLTMPNYLKIRVSLWMLLMNSGVFMLKHRRIRSMLRPVLFNSGRNYDKIKEWEKALDTYITSRRSIPGIKIYDLFLKKCSRR